MIIKKTLSDDSETGFSVVTIGTFDGVHVGHKKILNRLISTARANNLKSTIFTFFPHPRMVLQQDADIKLINTLDEKIGILKQSGLDQLIIYPFTREFSRLTALEFVRDVIVNKLRAKKVIIGYDHRFGRNRTATIDDLKKFGETYDFEVEEIGVEEVDEVSVSSTKIRRALSEGDMETANLYLGYDFMLTGEIVKGKGLGRQLNFPTANLQIAEKYKLIPGNGVYVVKSELNGQTVYGMMNIGFNPTVNGTKKSIEIHFFDFDRDLYGQKIQVDMLKRLRDEVRFDSVEELAAQLDKDREKALMYIGNRPSAPFGSTQEPPLGDR
ncbi:bifunctional riboflavin kinase/FAD synthetase [Sinomicrobium weinanense]|uniref:Riboflavin biosynthesis protein n=1 Tax=Sinomicrobium weinanense TaxID=2842200 RepID=A0A926JT35_9FLAO|nr:bifunctional riboflavin kinase/FAD synthetase [Sinomicrobium weinanense]MBU3124023.1 bifunctional riboflavin kinase/FAD synthetase [Sinomicrobium weinanense]